MAYELLARTPLGYSVLGRTVWTRRQELRLSSGMPLRMQPLQRLHSDLPSLQRGDPFSGGARRRQSRDGRNACADRGTANGFLIEEGIDTMRRVNDQLN